MRAWVLLVCLTGCGGSAFSGAAADPVPDAAMADDAPVGVTGSDASDGGTESAARGDAGFPTEAATDDGASEASSNDAGDSGPVDAQCVPLTAAEACQKAERDCGQADAGCGVTVACSGPTSIAGGQCPGTESCMQGGNPPGGWWTCGCATGCSDSTHTCQPGTSVYACGSLSPSGPPGPAPACDNCIASYGDAGVCVQSSSGNFCYQ